MSDLKIFIGCAKKGRHYLFPQKLISARDEQHAKEKLKDYYLKKGFNIYTMDYEVSEPI